MRAMVEVAVAYDSDITLVERVLSEVCAEMKAEMPQITEGPNAQGISDFGEAGMVFRIVAFTTPSAQWEVERELRRRIKLRFDQEHIVIPAAYRALFARGE
jgi:small conductance mechanosensitive channel